MFFRKPKETPVPDIPADQIPPKADGLYRRNEDIAPPPQRRGPIADPARPPVNRKFILYDDQSEAAALCDSVEAVNKKAREWFDDADDDEPLELIVAEVTGKITIKKETRIDLGPLA